MNKLIDKYGRTINYLRLAVTDRCNLRCYYCMPMTGIDYVPKAELMTFEEMTRLVKIVVGLGINKLRITGGEPFVRKDIMDFLTEMSKLKGLEKVHLTTNGTITAPFVPELKRLGIASVNLSLDSLDEERFYSITRKREYNKVIETFESLLHHGIRTKINTVVMEGRNEQDLIPLVMLTRDYPVDVRFIEEMPFNGDGAHYETLKWNHKMILEALKQHFPDIQKVPDPPYSTSYNYLIPGHLGKVGIIAAYSRTFCGTCNRIRLTPKGTLRTCLYDNGTFNIKELLRNGATDEQISVAIAEAVSHKTKDGFEAEKNRFGPKVSESMATIGG